MNYWGRRDLARFESQLLVPARILWPTGTSRLCHLRGGRRRVGRCLRIVFEFVVGSIFTRIPTVCAASSHGFLFQPGYCGRRGHDAKDLVVGSSRHGSQLLVPGYYSRQTSSSFSLASSSREERPGSSHSFLFTDIVKLVVGSIFARGRG